MDFLLPLILVPVLLLGFAAVGMTIIAMTDPKRAIHRAEREAAEGDLFDPQHQRAA